MIKTLKQVISALSQDYSVDVKKVKKQFRYFAKKRGLIENEVTIPSNAIKNEDHNTLIDNIKQSNFDDDRYKILKESYLDKKFSSFQVIEILECFEFSKAKVDICKLLTPRIYDLKQNKKRILEKLDFVQDREAVDKHFMDYLNKPSKEQINHTRV